MLLAASQAESYTCSIGVVKAYKQFSPRFLFRVVLCLGPWQLVWRAGSGRVLAFNK